MLQEFCFVPLDIFQQIYHNKGIRDRRDAWLVFLSMEEPEAILDLLECCPDFGKLTKRSIVYAGMWRISWKCFRGNCRNWTGILYSI